MNLKSRLNKYECLDGTRKASVPIATSELTAFDTTVVGTVDNGHGIASRPSERYPDGTIKLQYSHFLERGLNIGAFFPGTLNLSIAPQTFEITTPSHRFDDVNWFEARGKTENFLFCDCAVVTSNGALAGLIYYPDPSTKVGHPDNPHQLQILSPFIADVSVGDRLTVHLKKQQIELSGAEN